LLKYKGSGGKNSLPTATIATGHMSIIQSKICSKCKKLLPLEKFYNEKQRKRNSCKACDYKRLKEWRIKNSDKIKKIQKNFYAKHKKRLSKQKAKYYSLNKEKTKAAQWRWECLNKDKRNAINSRKRAKKKQALAPWVDHVKVKAIYKEAAELTQTTGISHHVDHVYPLTSDFLCGLHVETNLQILKYDENIRKKNKYWPGQLDCQKGSVYDIFPKELTKLLNDQN